MKSSTKSRSWGQLGTDPAQRGGRHQPEIDEAETLPEDTNAGKVLTMESVGEQEQVEQIYIGNNYSHPWIRNFYITYTTDYSHGPEKRGTPGTFEPSIYPQVLEVHTPFGETYQRPLREFAEETWVQFKDSEGRGLPLQIYKKFSEGVWCKWLKPIGPR